MSWQWLRDQALELSLAQERMLEERVIDMEGPGTILRDFESLLDFLQERRVRPTEKLRLLPLRVLPEVNARMTHPLQLGLQRPQQKSFPHINGLYLLIRSAGLTRVDEHGNRPRLVIDEEVYQRWAELNPTERYFNLLETWLLRARPEAIGERGWGLFPVWETYSHWLMFFLEVPEDGLRIADAETESSLRYYPGWHDLGLMELFGLVSVEDRVSAPGEGWRIKRVEREPFGDALLTLLHRGFFADVENFLLSHEVKRMPVGSLQPVLEPYFPAWERNLRVPQWVFREGTYTFRVSLDRMWWCRVAIPSSSTLEALASAILDAVAFTHDHLYQFSYQNRFGVDDCVYHPYMDEGPWADEVRIGDLPLGMGQTMTYLYDFGDWWGFAVVLERVDPDDSSVKHPQIVSEGGTRPEQYRYWGDWY
jgi:hypothetical protein